MQCWISHSSCLLCAFILGKFCYIAGWTSRSPPTLLQQREMKKHIPTLASAEKQYAANLMQKDATQKSSHNSALCIWWILKAFNNKKIWIRWGERQRTRKVSSQESVSAWTQKSSHPLAFFVHVFFVSSPCSLTNFAQFKVVFWQRLLCPCIFSLLFCSRTLFLGRRNGRQRGT